MTVPGIRVNIRIWMHLVWMNKRGSVNFKGTGRAGISQVGYKTKACVNHKWLVNGDGWLTHDCSFQSKVPFSLGNESVV